METSVAVRLGVEMNFPVVTHTRVEQLLSGRDPASIQDLAFIC